MSYLILMCITRDVKYLVNMSEWLLKVFAFENIKTWLILLRNEPKFIRCNMHEH